MPALATVHHDEHFINRSLLASLDAQADAEPNHDHDHPSDVDRFRPDSPVDGPYPHQDYPPYDYSHEFEYPTNNSYRAFTSYPNTTRSRHHATQSVLAPFRDAPAFYPPTESFINSPPVQQYDPRNPYDFNPQSKSYLVDQYPAKANQQYSTQTPYSNGVQLSSQTPYGPHVPAMPGSSNPSVPPPGLASSVSLSLANGTHTSSNGEEISTIFVVGFPEDMQEREFQNMFTFSSGFEAATLKIPNKEYTAYGSLVNGPGTSLPNGTALRGPGAFQYTGSNDPYNLVTVNQGGVLVDGGRDGTMASWPAAAPTPDDAGHYLGAGPGSHGAMGLANAANLNLPPRKQIIGFAKFRSREEALVARDILQGRRVDIEKGAVLKAEMAKKNLHTKRGVGPVPGVGVTVQTQQQQPHLSVGGLDAFNIDPSFAPPTPNPPSAIATSTSTSSNPLARLGWRDSVSSVALQASSSQAQGQQQQLQVQGLMDSHSAPTNVNPLPTHASNSNGATEEDRKRDSIRDSVLSLSGLSLASAGANGSLTATSQRGPRERVEDDERELRRKNDANSKDRDREMNLIRLRANNIAAYDAFHGVPASASSGAAGISRQSSNASNNSASSGSGKAGTLWTPATTVESVSSSSPMFESQGQQHREEDTDELDRQHHDEIVGPWDRINHINAAISRPANASGSERSSSPPPTAGFGIQQQHQQGYQYQPQFLHLHEQQQQAQQQQQQQYHSSQSESSETGSVVGASSAVDNANANPIGYVGAQLFFAPSSSASQQGQNGFPRGLAGYMTQPIGGGNGNGPSPPGNPTAHASNSNTINTGTSATSGSSSTGSASGGHTSPQLPSPASASGGSGASGSSGSTSGTSASTNPAASLVRGTVDQNPPINTLYVGNLPTSPPPIGYPSDYLEETLREVFSVRPGYRKLCFRHKANGPMCFVEFEDVPYAAKALVEMSGNTLRGAVKNGIRLSYSKNPLGVRTPTSAGSNAGGPTLQQQQQLMQTLSNHHQQYHHQQQQHQMPPPPLSASSTNSADPFQSRLADEFGGHVNAPLHHRMPLPSAILRRDSAMSPNAVSSLAAQAQSYMGSNGNGNNNGNGNGGGNYFSSPPPRFYSASPGSAMAFGGAPSSSASSSTPLTSASSAFVPRSQNGGMFNGGGGFGGLYGGAQQQASFSPFGVPPFSGQEGGPFGQPHLQPLSIPIDQQHQQLQQGGLGDD